MISKEQSFSYKVKTSIAGLNLLNHPFYQAWSEGQLTKRSLKDYAGQYYTHVKAFPRYISATHSCCEEIENRKVLLENLADEEGLHGEHHPELWLRFADGLGLSRDEIKKQTARKAIKDVVTTFLTAGRSSYHEGLASLYAYEYQVPEIAKTKIAGLQEHYSINDERSLSFFSVHQEADVHHRKACEKLMDAFSASEQEEALVAANKAATALWDFLSDCQSEEEQKTLA